jgi:hemerythrin superfamily protein
VPTGIDLILDDHRRVEELFTTFQETSDPAAAGLIFNALALHDEAEQGALYPLALGVLADAPLLDEALLAHARVKLLTDHARQQEGGPLLAAMLDLQRAVAAHVEAEETKLLPALAERATPEQLDGLASRIRQIKQRVG